MKFVRIDAIAVIAFGLFTSAATTIAAEWIWAPGDRLPAHGEVEFAKKFTLDSQHLSRAAELRAIGEFCAYKIYINGNLVAEADPFDTHLAVEVKSWLREGDNTVTVKAETVAGPSAVALEVALIESSGVERKALAASGDDWSGAVAIAPLASLNLGRSRLREIGALDEYNQWTEARSNASSKVSDSRFSRLPDGFELQRLRIAGPDEGSWVSMAFDPKGRLVVAKEQKGLLRMTFDEDQKITAIDPIEDTLLECRGLLFAHGALYANANNSKALYRLRDPDGDDRYDIPELLMETEGGVGHGRNDLAIGPDGMIYSIHGDSVKLPTDVLHLTPPIKETRGEKGYLIRIDPEGNSRELVAIGLRNPYGIAFNRDGEPFTFDADNEGDIGLPLYRPTRVNHLVSGANYGWQQASGDSWPVYYPESLPTTFDIGRGSPTSVEFGYRSNFPHRYREALYILDWAYGRIIAVDVIPRGASYACQAEVFLRGRPLNVTDLAFGPDGAMYFITGGRGTQSALYRVRYIGQGVAGQLLTAQESARASFSAASRAHRRRLESFHGKQSLEAVAESWPHLTNADPWIRHAARVAIEHQPPESWSARALEESNTTALLALIRVGSESQIDAILKRVQAIQFDGLSRSEKLTVVRLHEIALQGAPSQERTNVALAFLSSLLPKSDAAVNRELSKILIALGDESATKKALALLAAADSQFERLHYMEVLSRAVHGWPEEGRKSFFGALQHRDYFRGDSNMPGYLKQIHEQAVATLTAEERDFLGPLIAPSTPQDAPIPEPRPVVKHWKIDDLNTAPPKGFAADPRRGQELFERALCSRCHQAGGIGAAVGPNLTAIAQRFSRRDLIEAVIDPSRAVAEIFRPLVITKNDGTIIAGRVVRDDIRNSTISLSTNPFAPDQLTVVSKKDIRSHEIAPGSPMPPNLLDSLTKEEVFHLLAFLEAGGTARKSSN